MKKILYIHPVTEVTAILPFRLICASQGWAKDGNPPTDVEREDAVSQDDKLPSSLWDDDSYGGFLDLD